jgi:hypothetical protein
MPQLAENVILMFRVCQSCVFLSCPGINYNQKEMAEYLELRSNDESKRLMAQRKEIVEHPFGTLKRSLGYTIFLLQGMEKVTAEFNLMCSAYNLKRVFNIVGFQNLLAAIR